MTFSTLFTLSAVWPLHSGPSYDRYIVSIKISMVYIFSSPHSKYFLWPLTVIILTFSLFTDHCSVPVLKKKMYQTSAMYTKRRLWWGWSGMYLLLVAMILYGQVCSAEVVTKDNKTTNNTHFVITLKAPINPPKNFQPKASLHQEAALMSKSIPNSSIVYMFDNIATYFNIYMFSIQLEKNEDLTIIGKLYQKKIKSIEAVTTFIASELVTDVRNLAHGLPYRQVLNRPFRDLTELSG